MKRLKRGTAGIAISLGLLAGCAAHKPATPQALTEDAFFRQYADEYPCETADPRAIAQHMIDPWTGEVSCYVQSPLPDYCNGKSTQGKLPAGYVPVMLLNGGIDGPGYENYTPVVATPEAAATIVGWNNALRRIKTKAKTLIEGLDAYHSDYPFSENRPDINYHLATLRATMSNDGRLAISPGEEGSLCSFVIGADSAEFVFPGINTFYVTATLDGFVTSVVKQTKDGEVSFLTIPQGDPSCLGWPENLQRGVGSQAGNFVTQCLAETTGAREPFSSTEGELLLASLERQLFMAGYITQGLPECCPPDSCKPTSKKILGAE